MPGILFFKMKKILALFVTVLAAGNISFSQNYTFDPSSKQLVINLPLNDSDFKGIYFKNVSSSPLTLNWTLLSTNTLSDCMFGMCASGNCLNGIPATGTFPILQASDTGWVKLHCFTGNTPGTNVIKILVGESQKTMDTLTFIITVSPTGIKEQKHKLSFDVFPNPASDKISLKLQDQQVRSGELQVYNLSGETVMQQTLTNGSIDIRSLAPGLYFLRLRSGEKLYSTRFLKN